MVHAPPCSKRQRAAEEVNGSAHTKPKKAKAMGQQMYDDRGRCSSGASASSASSCSSSRRLLHGLLVHHLGRRFFLHRRHSLEPASQRMWRGLGLRCDCARRAAWCLRTPLRKKQGSRLLNFFRVNHDLGTTNFVHAPLPLRVQRTRLPVDVRKSHKLHAKNACKNLTTVSQVSCQDSHVRQTPDLCHVDGQP
jgi:hypothetical protein